MSLIKVDSSHCENFITGLIRVDEDDKDIRLFNSYEDFRKNGLEYDKHKENNKDVSNEKEIKDIMQIEIESKAEAKKTEDFYRYKFPKKGTYRIKYSFSKKLTKANYLFCWCYSLTSLDLSNFKTEDITGMSMMFRDCISLTSLVLSKINTEKVSDMSMLFYGCKLLTSLDLSNFNTENVTNMEEMFSCCESLTSLDLSNFNTKNVIYMTSMFYDCNSLKYLTLSNFTFEKVVDMEYMFSRCKSLKKVVLPDSFDKDNLQKHNMIGDLENFQNIISSNSNTSSFCGCFSKCFGNY